MMRRLALGVVVLGVLAGVPIAAEAAPAPQFSTLAPGGAPRLTETVPVQVVFVGYEPETISEEYLREYLPPTIKPVDRRRSWEGHVTELGLEYSFDYSIRYADAAYEDAFFGYLSDIGVDERNLTGYDQSLFQYLYNLQPGRSLDITNNLVIDGAKAERWLVEHPAAGVDPGRDTLVFINWWGRPDFRFHDYRITGEQQSETGVDLGAALWNSRMVAWGGTSISDEETGFGRASRTWFHDLSAGPDYRGAGWVIDDTLGGYGPDPNEKMFFPPVWEYANNNPAIANRWALPDALGVISRFVAMNMLFAPSPLYGTDLDAVMTTDVELDVTVQSELTRPVFTPSRLQQEVGDLLGFTPRVDVEHRPLAGMPRKCHYDFAAGQRCRPETDPSIYDPDFNLFLGAENTRAQWQDGSAELEAASFVHATQATEPKWLGVALGNPLTDNRTAAWVLTNTRRLNAGYGATSTLVHEYGHYFGLSHSHDGWEGNWWTQNYSAQGNPLLYFAWLGTEVSSSMSYQFVNDDFSTFDHDNYARWQAIRYLRAANKIAGDVMGSRRASSGAASLVQADALFTAAQAALANHDYRNAERSARDGYAAVRRAAVQAGVAVAKIDASWAMAQPGKWRGHGVGDASGAANDPVDQIVPAAVPAHLIDGFNRTR